MRIRWQWARWVVVAVGAGMVALWALRSPPIMVDAAVVDEGPVTVTVDEEGKTRVRDRFVVTAPITGRLRRIILREGRPVRQNDLLAIIDPSPLDPRTRQEAEAGLEAALDAERVAAAAREQARDALAQAAREHARMEALFRQNVIAPEARERAALAEESRRRELEAADFRSQSAGHEVERARANLTAAGGGRSGRVEIRAPASGAVLRVAETSERVVAAGTPLIEIGNAHQLEVEIDVLSEDAVRIVPGDPIRFSGWGGDSTLVGRVLAVEPSGFTKVSALGVEEQRVNVIGVIDPAPARLGDRYRVRAEITVWRAERATRVPRTALFRVSDSWRAFVIEGGRARERQVSIGRQSTDWAQVITGVRPGERVITHPDERIIEGARVEPRS